MRRFQSTKKKKRMKKKKKKKITIVARFDLALLIILIFHDRNRFFNHQSRRTHLIHNVDERDPPSKGCIRNGIISSHPPPPSRGRNIFFARLFTDPANNRENATRIIIWASRGVLSPARDEKWRVCVRKVCAREFFFFLFFPPPPPFFFDTAKRARAHPPATGSTAITTA